MDLLELPSEIISSFFTTFILSHGLRAALKARSVCKRFEAEISLAICLTRALEGPDCPKHLKSSVGLRTMTEYFFLQTVADHSQNYAETKAIHYTLDYIYQKQPQCLLPDVNYIWEACAAITGQRGYFDLSTNLKLGKGTPSIAENAFAFVAYLGIASLLQAFIEEGVADVNTYFGRPLKCITRHPGVAIASTYLKTKLKTQQGMRRERASIKPVDNSEATQIHARGISAADYNCAITMAVWYGHMETTHLLIKAAFDDGEFGTGSTMGFSCLRPVKRQRDAIQDAILVLAVRFSKFDIARAALDHGADPNVEGRFGKLNFSVVETAARSGSSQMVELLLQRGAKTRSWRTGSPLLSAAASGGCLATAKLVIDAGGAAGPEPWPVRNHPLSTAVEFQKPKMLDFLLKNGLKPEIGSPLHDYASWRAVGKVGIEIQAILAQHLSDTPSSLDRQSTDDENAEAAKE